MFADGAFIQICLNIITSKKIFANRKKNVINPISKELK
jgi:Na+-transporting NADH:ubiquinone oxidoreductase subunit NqrB